jgi:6-phosphogluconolactonase (cycloisomerase 2 family)
MGLRDQRDGLHRNRFQMERGKGFPDRIPNHFHAARANRGHDSIAVFAIDQKTGKLTLVERVSSQGKWPRNFTFDPTGKWILCSNHNSDNTVVFRVDENTGKLTQVGQPVEVPYPFCERFLPAP